MPIDESELVSNVVSQLMVKKEWTQADVTEAVRVIIQTLRSSEVGQLKRALGDGIGAALASRSCLLDIKRETCLINDELTRSVQTGQRFSAYSSNYSSVWRVFLKWFTIDISHDDRGPYLHIDEAIRDEIIKDLPPPALAENLPNDDTGIFEVLTKYAVSKQWR